MRRSAFVLALALLLALGLPTRSAAAQSMAQRWQARKLGGEAFDLIKAGDYKAALAKFEKADQLVPAPTLKVQIARCLDKLDRMHDAAEKYREVIAVELGPRSPAQFQKARNDAVAELSKLLAEQPKLTVLVTGPGSDGAEVTVDGKPLARSALGEEQPVDPGFYQLKATLGAREASQSVRLGRGHSERAMLDFPALPPPVPEGPDLGLMRRAGYGLVGVGGAGLIAGVVAGALAVKDRSALSQQFPDGSCNAAVEDCGAVGRLNAERTASTVGFVVALGGLGSGVPLLIYAAIKGKRKSGGPDKPAALVWSPYWSGTSAGIAGTF